MSHTEADRKAYNEFLKNTEARLERDIAINKWLDENPPIGTLNGVDKFYIIENGEQVMIKPLQKLN